MDADVKKRYDKLKSDALSGGYRLNADEEFVMMLCGGLLKNKERYGIEACPCRLYIGTQEENLDVVCPCVYRDDDLAEYGACFCAMYVSSDDISGQPDKQIPDRRPPYSVRKGQKKPEPELQKPGTLVYPVFRCSVCGYLCARNNPPEVCPVCKAKKDRFERFM